MVNGRELSFRFLSFELDVSLGNALKRHFVRQVSRRKKRESLGSTERKREKLFGILGSKERKRDILQGNFLKKRF